MVGVRRALVLIGIGALAVFAVAALVGLPGHGDDSKIRYFIPELGKPVAVASPAEPREPVCHATADLRRATTLYRKPGGRPWMRLTGHTEWGSPRVLGVVRRKREWLGVQAPELRNGELGWLPVRTARVGCTTWSLHADLSERRLVVRRGRRTVRSLSVAVGRVGHATPQGRFSVTDKLRVTDPGSPYGCCVLALSGHQVNLPAGWPGGDRLAVHATHDLASIGQEASLGCLRGAGRQVRWLIETIPQGAPVFVRS